ncbi:MAG: adenosylhomocysteinase, partial [Thermoplasmata archaeon]|nr:adenosylhomocysteinase [Thermoplasmata archaeon]
MTGNLELGRLKIAWARTHMPVLGAIARRFATEKPFAGRRLSAVLHVEAKTAVLALALHGGGAEIRLAAGNPLSTDDDAVAALIEGGVQTWARKGESVEEYTRGIHAMLESDPEILIDDGADLVALAHTARKDRGSILGSTEETTTGVTRLRAMEKAHALRFPAIDVNDAAMKHLFDNRFGCGQSFLDGLFSATNLLVAGRTCVVAGYGWVGKGIASRLRGVGAEVIVTEVDPVRAIEARLEGF